MQEVSVIIPNFNGMAYLDGVLAGLECQTVSNFDVILVDNGSNDGSCAFVAARYPWVHLIELPENFGFCKAVNEGIRASRSPYVLLLNNDIEVTENFIEEMLSAIKRHPKAFSCAARMIQFHDRDRLDDAGNYYCALGWAYARGKGKDIHTYEKEEKIFASCAGAAIYRKKIFDELGYFDEEHFAYLEDMDVGYRARIYGYENWYAPDAMVYHVGSGTSGSRYNQFKIRYSSRNNIYLIYKNMPVLQSLFIDDLCVDQHARGQHIGESLFEYVKNEAKRMGCYEVTLNVWAGNTSAEKFYEKMGMKTKERQMEYILEH